MRWGDGRRLVGQVLDILVQACRGQLGKSGCHILEGVVASATVRTQWIRCSQEKPLSFSLHGPYRKPTQVGRDENTKALERTQEKELGKMVP
jgi:hypothetical protein